MAFVERKRCEVFLILFCFEIATGNTFVTPSNTAVVAGNWMSMECRTTNGSYVYRWTFERPNSSEIDHIFWNHDGKRELISNNSLYFGVDMDESCSGHLYSNTTRLEDAGVYACRAYVEKKQVVFSAHLTVLESEPICETNYTADATLTEGDRIWMQCTVNFRGMWAPTVEWRLHTVGLNDTEQKDDQQTILHGVSTVTVLNNRVTSTLMYVSGSSKTTYFSCRIFFSWQNDSVKVTATNLPNFTFTWKSPRLVPHLEEVRSFSKTTQKPSGSSDWCISDHGSTRFSAFQFLSLCGAACFLYCKLLIPVRSAELEHPKDSQSKIAEYREYCNLCKEIAMAEDIISLILFFAVLVFVSLLVGLGIRRYVRFRRARDLNAVCNASTSSTAPSRRQERPSSIEYAIIPTATPNIYERIDGADADDDATEQATTSQNHSLPPLTDHSSGLMATEGTATCYYDNVDQYEKMDRVKLESDPTARKTPESPNQETEEENYTKLGLMSVVAKPNLTSGSSDYIEMSGGVKESKPDVDPFYIDVPNDSDEDNYLDDKLKGFDKDSDDYLQPGHKLVDNCPIYLQIV